MPSILTLDGPGLPNTSEIGTCVCKINRRTRRQTKFCFVGKKAGKRGSGATGWQIKGLCSESDTAGLSGVPSERRRRKRKK